MISNNNNDDDDNTIICLFLFCFSGIQCEGGKEYVECGRMCGNTCGELAQGTSCPEHCVAGCFCPNDQVRFCIKNVIRCIKMLSN